MKLTYYWRCDEPLEDGWLLFTHTKDDGSGKMGNLDFVGPLRDARANGHQVLGPERWEKGKVYVDEQTYKVPDDVNGTDVTVFVGIWKGDARLRIVSGPNDGDNSAIVGKIKTGVQPKPAEEQHTSTEVPSLNVAQARGERQDHHRRQAATNPNGGAPRAPALSSTWGRVSPTPRSRSTVRPRSLWDDKNLYILFDVQREPTSTRASPTQNRSRGTSPWPASRSSGRRTPSR